MLWLKKFIYALSNVAGNFFHNGRFSVDRSQSTLERMDSPAPTVAAVGTDLRLPGPALNVTREAEPYVNSFAALQGDLRTAKEQDREQDDARAKNLEEAEAEFQALMTRVAEAKAAGRKHDAGLGRAADYRFQIRHRIWTEMRDAEWQKVSLSRDQRSYYSWLKLNPEPEREAHEQ